MRATRRVMYCKCEFTGIKGSFVSKGAKGKTFVIILCIGYIVSVYIWPECQEGEFNAW